MRVTIKPKTPVKVAKSAKVAATPKNNATKGVKIIIGTPKMNTGRSRSNQSMNAPVLKVKSKTVSIKKPKKSKK